MKINGVVAGVLASVAAYLLVTRLVGGGVAPPPAGFVKGTTLDTNLTIAKASHKPVVALVTADWCGPCQALKRGAMSDRQVVSWLGQNAVCAYVDGTEASNPDLGRLNIELFPTLLMIRDGREVARLTGNREAGLVLAWLQDAAAKPVVTPESPAGG